MTAEEVAAIHVACRLGRYNMFFDNPSTQERETWLRGEKIMTRTANSVNKFDEQPFGYFESKPLIWDQPK